MTDRELMQQALEALEADEYDMVPDQEGHMVFRKEAAITALRERLAQPEQEPVLWRNAAIRVGEELSSVGPDGYYDMTAEQWLDWAMAQEPRGKNSLAQPNEFNPDWDAMAVMVAEQQRIAKRIEELEAKPREWQWLTEEEIEVQIQRVMPYFGLHPMDYNRGGLPTIMFYGLVKETEVKLKKKNT